MCRRIAPSRRSISFHDVAIERAGRLLHDKRYDAASYVECRPNVDLHAPCNSSWNPSFNNAGNVRNTIARSADEHQHCGILRPHPKNAPETNPMEVTTMNWNTNSTSVHLPRDNEGGTRTKTIRLVTRIVMEFMGSVWNAFSITSRTQVIHRNPSTSTRGQDCRQRLRNNLLLLALGNDAPTGAANKACSRD